MENRKVMKLGRASLVISLPKYWIDLSGVKSGDFVSVVSNKDGSLAIYPKREHQKKEKDVVLNIAPYENKETITRKIIASYLNGYDIIRLTSLKMFTLEQQRVIRSVAGKISANIIEAHSREVLLQILTDLTRVSIQKSVERVHFITASMLQDVLKALEKMNVELAKVVYSLDDDVDQFCIILLRTIRSCAFDLTLANLMGLEPIDFLEYQMVVQNIEHIADQASFVAIRIIELHNKPILQKAIEPTISIGYETYRIYENAVRAFLRSDERLANEVINTRSKINELATKVIKSSIGEKCETACLIYRILEGFERVAEYGKDIAKVAIDRALYKG